MNQTITIYSGLGDFPTNTQTIGDQAVYMQSAWSSAFAPVISTKLYCVGDEINAHVMHLDINSCNLLKPIPVVIEIENHNEFIASFPEAGIAMTGESAAESLQLLKEEIVACYELYKKESSLGPEPKRQLKVLENYIGKRET